MVLREHHLILIHDVFRVDACQREWHLGNAFFDVTLLGRVHGKFLLPYSEDAYIFARGRTIEQFDCVDDLASLGR